MGRSDRGSATVWLLAATAVVAAVATAATALVEGLAIRLHAAAAADAAALAGATAVDGGAGAACRAAAALARTDGAAVATCSVDGARVTVRVREALPGPLHLAGDVTAVATAGPASGPDVPTASPPGGDGAAVAREAGGGRWTVRGGHLGRAEAGDRRTLGPPVAAVRRRVVSGRQEAPPTSEGDA